MEDALKCFKSPLEVELDNLTKRGLLYLRNNYLNDALADFQAAHQISLKQNCTSVQRTALFNVGTALLALHNPEDAIKCFLNARPPDGLRDGVSNGDIYYNMSLACYLLNDFSESANYMERAFYEYQVEVDGDIFMKDTASLKMEDRQFLIKVLEKVADRMRRCGKFEKSEHYYRLCDHYLSRELFLMECYGIADEERELQLKQISLTHLQIKLELVDILAREKTNYKEMDIILEEANALVKFVMKNYKAQFHYEIGCGFLRLANFRSAEESLLSALEQLSHVKYKDRKLLQVKIYAKLGLCLVKGQMCENALPYLQKVIQLCADLPRQHDRGVCWYLLGKSHERVGNGEEAEKAFKNALMVAEATQDNQLRWKTLKHLGEVLWKRGDHELGERQFQEAIDICDNELEVKEKLKQRRNYLLDSLVKSPTMKENSQEHLKKAQGLPLNETQAENDAPSMKIDEDVGSGDPSHPSAERSLENITSWLGELEELSRQFNE